MKPQYNIRLETKADYRIVEHLTRDAFWNVYRPGCVEHYILHRFRGREEFIPELSLVLEKDGVIIGHIMYVRSFIQADDGQSIPVMTFGPLSIAPAYQRQGYGTILVQESLQKAKELGARAVCITGDIDFYGKSGFVAGKTVGIFCADDPDADYFLVKELETGFLDSLSGTYKDPEGYIADEKEIEAFDWQFPPKQKLKLPGQLFQA